jgi:NADPH:quinone reductase-like Zn-dependent oxidoreductase
MKAFQYHRYGPPDVLSLDEVEKPVPGDDEVLIRIRATSVNPYDWHFMRGTPYLMRIGTGLRTPKRTRLGVDVAGVVEAIGKDVTRLKPGDEVFGVCRGAWAEYACARERDLAPKPANVSFEDVAAVPIAALTALQAIRRGGVRASQKVLINGASGGVGTYVVQIAKTFGAEVAGVCSTGNVELVRSIGADEVFDYTRDDFTRSGQKYDAIIDCIGNHSFASLRRVLTREGIDVVVGGKAGNWLSPLPTILAGFALSTIVSQKMAFAMSKLSRDDLMTIAALLEKGTIRSVIDRRYTFADLPEAVRYQEQGQARGKVVVTVAA